MMKIHNYLCDFSTTLQRCSINGTIRTDKAESKYKCHNYVIVICNESSRVDPTNPLARWVESKSSLDWILKKLGES
jgi:hypothetical protein